IRFTVREPAKQAASLDVSYADLADLGDAELGMLWPELASRVGATLDRRGIIRAVEFTRLSEVGGRIQLSGGWELVRARDWLELRAARSAPHGNEDPRQLTGGLSWGRWRFSVVEQSAGGDPWLAELGG